MDNSEEKNSEIGTGTPTVENKTKVHGPHPFIVILLILDLLMAAFFAVAYLPFEFCQNCREYFIPYSLQNPNRYYLAHTFYSEETINKTSTAYIERLAKGIENEDEILLAEEDEPFYVNPYEEEILTREEGQLYKIYEIRENGYAGFICVVYDPKQLDIRGSTTEYGDRVSKIARYYNALVAVNASAFVYDRETYCMCPTLDIIGNYQLIKYFGRTGSYIGMNGDGQLILKYGTYDVVKDDNLKWGTQFGPHLIIDGQPVPLIDSYFGSEPRTAIGQRKDGITIIIVLDGRGFNDSRGATMSELIALFQRYDCYNAANLDGGGSSVIVEKGVVLNSPCEGDRLNERRNVSAICLFDYE